VTTAIAAVELVDAEGLYLLHLEPRYRHAGHRLGWSTNVRQRVEQHLAAGPRSSPLIRAQLAAGGRAVVTRVWVGGDRTLEARLKRGGGLSRHCPHCRATGRYHA
jgi:hypothetical protein